MPAIAETLLRLIQSVPSPKAGGGFAKQARQQLEGQTGKSIAPGGLHSP